VGGSQLIEQTYISTHANPAGRDIYLLDGMPVNTVQNEGLIQIYIDDGMIQESTYQTSNVTAEVGGGRVYTNLILKDGGNEFHGQLFLRYGPSQFVGNNVTSALSARGVTGQSAVNRLKDVNGRLGGPIIKDKLWFLVGGRKQLSFGRPIPSIPMDRPLSRRATSGLATSASRTGSMPRTEFRRCGFAIGRLRRMTWCFRRGASAGATGCS
jgi:hypothetical protein